VPALLEDLKKTAEHLREIAGGVTVGCLAVRC
jgi:hypothetical protein